MVLAQQELFPDHPPRSLTELISILNEGVDRTITVHTTNNRVRMLTIDFDHDATIVVRLHQAYLAAPPHVILALKQYLRKRRSDDWEIVARYARYIKTNNASKRAPKLMTKGQHHNLKAILKQVNQSFFNGRIQCRITWGRRPASKRRATPHSFYFGSYDEQLKLIRINALLDSERVPSRFLEFIVFHEMLHAVVPSECKNGRYNHHPRPLNTWNDNFPIGGKCNNCHAGWWTSYNTHRPPALPRSRLQENQSEQITDQKGSSAVISTKQRNTSRVCFRGSE